jgi:hypothetical protein
MCAFALSRLDASEGGSRRAKAPRRSGLTFAALLAAATVLGFASRAQAQAIPITTETTASPWNAQRIFDPTPLPELTAADNREPVAPEDMPVSQRQQPGYEPVGIRDGSWMFLPSFLAGGFYDSNVFSSNILKRSDIAATIEPSLRAYTLWERHGIDVTLDAQEIAYNGNPGLDQTNASLKGNAWYDISHDTTLLTNFQIAHLNLAVGSLNSPAGAVQPTPYDFFSGDVSLRKEFNRLVTSVGFRTDSYDYGSTRAADGTLIDQSSLSGQVYSLHGRADYAVSSMFGVFVAAEGNDRNVKGLPGQPLDSQGYRALSGVTFGLTNLITGEIGAGYVQQQFVDRTIGTVAGPSYRAKLTWRPTRLLDVNFKAEQLVTETSQTSSAGVLANAVQLGADYELLRNVVLSATGAYETDRFFGMVRKDHVVTSDERVKYMLSRYGSIAIYHTYTNRNSDVPIFSYDKHQVGINVTAQF